MKSKSPKSRVDELKGAFIDGMIAMAMAKQEGLEREFEAICAKYLAQTRD